MKELWKFAIPCVSVQFCGSRFSATEEHGITRRKRPWECVHKGSLVRGRSKGPTRSYYRQVPAQRGTLTAAGSSNSSRETPQLLSRLPTADSLLTLAVE